VAKDDLSVWKDRIRSGLRFQQEFAKASEWKRYKERYRHQGFPEGSIPMNILFSLLRSLVPQVYFRNPRVSITPRKPGLEAELNARIVQRLDNWLLAELSTKREFKKLIADNFFCGFGAGCVGYDSQAGFDTGSLDATGQYTLTQFDKSGNRIEFNSTVNPGMPWFLRFRPEDIIFPHGSTDKESLEWFAVRFFRQVDDLKKDRKYGGASDLTGSHEIIRTSVEGTASVDIKQIDKVNQDVQWVELWQVHNARDGKVKALVLDHNKMLRNDPDELQVEGLPFEFLCFNPDPDYIYGVPDARIIYPQLVELTDIRTQAMRHRRVDLLKTFINEDVLSEEEIQKYTNNEVQAIIRVKAGLTGDIRSVVAPINPGAAGILQDMALQAEQVRGDVREAVGFSRTAMGEFQGKTHISAEETKTVMQALNIRLDERRDQMADLVGGVVRKWNQIIFKHWTNERIAQIVGPDGSKYWVKFTGQQIKEEYDLSVNAEEGPPLDRQTKKNLALEAARTWAELNQGAIKAGTPVPAEIQRLIFNQFEETGLDIDRLLAQTGAAAQTTQAMMADGAGSSADNPAQVPQLAQAMGGMR